MIVIGKEIKRVLKERGMTISEFAKRINTHRRNVYDIFERKSIDTSLLQEIGKILSYDFFTLYKTPKFKLPMVNENAGEDIINYPETSKLKRRIEALEHEINLLKERLSDKEKIIELLEKKK
ncbi:MAG: helix-turn-helix domain-containing protein [Bacteroidota bacterium]